MKQILQHLRTGATELADVPCPALKDGEVLIRSSRTLVSIGTERMLVAFSQASLIGKARAQPERVQQVIDKARTDGIVPTLEAVFNKLDRALPLGYCNVGVVLEAGGGVTGFAPGDRVVSNGKHAEVISVPKNLCAAVPTGVSDEEAAFAVVAAIALQGIRLVQPSLGENIVVTGLGLIGLIAVQLLRAHGCRVLGIDYDPKRLEMARQLGAEIVDLSAGADAVGSARAFARGRGVDAVLICASTESSEPVHQAAMMCRKRGRIVLVGTTGLELSRADFYEKELTFQVSCSYGPGRYDPEYEQNGNDYPVGFVRWTAQRNFEAVLDMMADGRLDVRPLISHRFAFDRATEAYELVSSDPTALGIILEYPSREAKPDAVLRQSIVELKPGRSRAASPSSAVSLAMIGSGAYATAVLIPAFKAAGARLRTVVSSGGVSGVHAGKKFGFETTTTDTSSIFSDANVNTVVIATRHDSHAQLVRDALAADKHVFVEKPLALEGGDLRSIEVAYDATSTGGRPLLMIGFNRRFAPHTKQMKALLSGVREPKAFVMTVNAGAIPAEHWTQDVHTGGGRIVGEACHFIDLLRFLADSPIAGFQAMSIGAPDGTPKTDDRASFSLNFGDGSIGTIHYLANGHRSFPKERLEVFAGGRVLQLDNFRQLAGFGWPGFNRMNLWRQDKGQKACVAAFVRAVESGGPSPIPFNEIMEVSRVAIEVAAALR